MKNTVIPTIEQVKDIFKNAQTVMTAFCPEEINMDDFDIESIRGGGDANKNIWIISKEDSKLGNNSRNATRIEALFDDVNGLAEILTYKKS